ncbi:hypothetical protein TSUD_178170 [Trifolium subterraneum]|uniref:Uncharacterized protein n=1 Tax=Trifolium subterraneum TaxID=3900 RepID=A0A2Z6LMW5_TRISU|nr:hypothetical protein TSUD_178170 [Trifolium subterraneum]
MMQSTGVVYGGIVHQVLNYVQKMENCYAKLSRGPRSLGRRYHDNHDAAAADEALNFYFFQLTYGRVLKPLRRM